MFIVPATCSLVHAARKLTVHDMIPAGNAHSEGVEELLRQMTSEERISMLSTKSIAIARLNLTSFNWWTGATHAAFPSI